MKIKRTIDGREIEIELTEQELFDAFTEQEFIFDLDNVRNYFMDYTDEDFQQEYGISREEAESRFEDVASQLRRNIDKYDMDYEYAISEAIHTVF